MEALPPLAPVVPGRPALPAFGPVAAWIRERREKAGAEAERLLAEARDEAQRVRAEGEGRLREVLDEGRAEAVRSAEDRARDRVSRARGEVNRWVEAAERGLEPVLAEALDLLASDGTPG